MPFSMPQAGWLRRSRPPGHLSAINPSLRFAHCTKQCTVLMVLLCHRDVQAVLKRKTEEAEAARRKLRELTELQARVRRDKQAAAAAAGEASGGCRRQGGEPCWLLPVCVGA